MVGGVVIAVLLVALGSAAGSAARYVVDQSIQGRHDRVFPWGTWTVNITGAFGLGLLLSAAVSTGLHDSVVLTLGTGFLGAYTTFSTLVWETLRLAEGRALLAAATNVVGSILAGVLAAVGGIALGGLV